MKAAAPGTALVVLGLTAVLTAPSAASADPAGPASKDVAPAPATLALPGAGAVPGGFSSWPDLMREQERLTAAADRLLAAGGAGFAGVTVSAESRSVTLVYKGKPSAPVQAALDSVRKDVKVQLEDARFSLRQLESEARRVAKAEGVTAVAPKADGSGLIVSVAQRSAARAADAATDVPVTAEEVARPAALSRGNDSPPYWGGARWNGCSNGFAIRIAGVSKMLSAGHCGSNGGYAYDGGGQYMGTISGDSNAYDTLYINTYSAGRIYDGGVGTGEFSKPVVGASRSYVGQWLCTSGAYSGARCGIQVKATNQTIWVGSYYMYGMVYAEQVNRTNAAGNGDSGGPVFSLSADPNKVIAKGTISAGDRSWYGSATCTGVPASSTRGCSWRLWYADIANSLARYGASIVTG